MDHSEMITGQKMQDIAKSIAIIEDQVVKKYVVGIWEEIRVLSRTKSERWANKLINALIEENKNTVKKLLVS